jgi:hypothetical protein
MTPNDDQFFEEEADVARAQEAPRAPKAGKAAKEPEPAARAAARGGARKPPSFALVVAIAAVALLLGVCVGYFMAMAVVSTSTNTTAVSEAASDDGDDALADATMPADHPDLSQFMGEDGEPDMDKVAAWRAENGTDEADEADDEGDDAAGTDASEVDGDAANK